MFLCGKGPILALFVLALLPFVSYAWDSDDFELFDLVEEVKRNFYEVLGLDQSATSADIRRAYRRLSLQLHPDKNKEEGAEEQFRQLVAIADVLKDEEKRQRYDHVLEHGLPDWRQPVYYYRRVRKMGLLELSILLTIILTVGHYLVIWSMYWERRFELEESIFSKKKKKSKKSSKQAGENQTQPDPLSILDDPSILSKPQISDIIPCQIYRLIKAIILGIPPSIVWTIAQIQEWKESRKRQEEEDVEEEDEEEEVVYDDKERIKRRQRINPALYEYDRTSIAPVTNVGSQNVCDTKSAINDEQQLQSKQSGSEWTPEDTSKLIRAMAKYPGGTSARWEKIASEVGWPVDQVTKKAKAIKTSGYATHVDTAAQGITGGVRHTVISKSGKVLGDDGTNLPNNQTSSNDQSTANGYDDKSYESQGKHKTAKPIKSSDRTLVIMQQQQRNAVDKSRTADESDEKQDDGANDIIYPGVESCSWTQRQQKVLEKALSVYPKGTDARWDKIADSVPGKSKEECIVRYKELVEVIKRKKQQATAAGDQ
ncbi:dnaJ homolog subfamily C member 1-like [Amphiura filiformis]|uniref:dnaJ homolog subfamily C member 1-like n=1 Tax=Amphiura filiformis TaxID=82378 RepID=UPI003B225685